MNLTQTAELFGGFLILLFLFAGFRALRERRGPKKAKATQQPQTLAEYRAAFEDATRREQAAKASLDAANNPRRGAPNPAEVSRARTNWDVAKSQKADAERAYTAAKLRA